MLGGVTCEPPRNSWSLGTTLCDAQEQTKNQNKISQSYTYIESTTMYIPRTSILDQIGTNRVRTYVWCLFDFTFSMCFSSITLKNKALESETSRIYQTNRLPMVETKWVFNFDKLAKYYDISSFQGTWKSNKTIINGVGAMISPVILHQYRIFRVTTVIDSIRLTI